MALVQIKGCGFCVWKLLYNPSSDESFTTLAVFYSRKSQCCVCLCTCAIPCTFCSFLPAFHGLFWSILLPTLNHTKTTHSYKVHSACNELQKHKTRNCTPYQSHQRNQFNLWWVWISCPCDEMLEKPAMEHGRHMWCPFETCFSLTAIILKQCVIFNVKKSRFNVRKKVDKYK